MQVGASQGEGPPVAPRGRTSYGPRWSPAGLNKHAATLFALPPEPVPFIIETFFCFLMFYLFIICSSRRGV